MYYLYKDIYIYIYIYILKFRNSKKLSVTMQTFSVVLTTSSDCYKILCENLQWLKLLYRESIKI